MKQGKSPTRKQKEMLKQKGLNPLNWLIVKNPPGELHIIHRHTGNPRVLKVS